MKQIIIFIAVTFSTTIFAKQVELKISSTYQKGYITTKMNEVKVIANMNKEFIITN